MELITASPRKLVLVCCIFGLMADFSIMAQDSGAREAELDASFGLEVEGSGMTVTGTRTPKRLKDTPVPVEVITAEEIEGSNADTVTDVLNDYGLVYTGNGMGDYVQMQGMGKNRILYLINGRRVSGRIAQRLKGETLPLTNIERIEIIRGPQSALYGSDALGGVINIITKKPPDTMTFSASLKNRFLLAYNDPKTAYNPPPFADFNPIREQNFNAVFGFPLGVSRNSIDIEASRGAFYYNETASASILPEYYRGRLGFDTNLELGAGLEVRFGGSGMVMRRDDQTTARGSLNRLDYLRAEGFAETSFWIVPNAMMTVRLYDNYYQRNRDAYSALNNIWTTGERYENDNIAALEVQGMVEATPHLLFTAGLDGAFSSMEKYNFTKDFVYLDRESLFLQGEYFTIDRFSVIGGLRVERNSMFGFAVSPKLSGMVHFGKGFRILGGAGVGYRAPDFSDLYMERDDEGGTATPVFGNPDLEPEYSLGFNLGLEYSNTLCFLQVNTYYNELFNEIGRRYNPDGNYYYNLNISRSLRLGVDSEGRLNLPYGLFVSAGYSWLYAWDRSTETEPFIQPNHVVKMKAGANIPRPKIYTWLQGRFFSKANDPARPDSEARFMLDFYFSIGLGKHFKLNFGIDNITGEMDRIGPETAQTFSLGLTYTM